MTNEISQLKLSLVSFFTMFVIGTDTFIVAPLLPTLGSTFNVDIDISGWMVSAYALGYTLLALFSGPISDRLDRRNVLLVGLIGFIVSTVLCGYAYSFETMILYRFLAGMSAAFVSPQIWASIPVLSKKENIVRTMGFATAGLSVSQIAGIPLGSYLASIEWKYSFWGISILSVALLLLLTVTFPSMKSNGHSNGSSMFQVYSQILKNRKLSIYLFGYFIFQVGNFEALSFYGSWFSVSFDFNLNEIGNAMIFIGIGNAIGSIYGTKLVPKIGLFQSLLVCIILLIIGYSIVPFSRNYYEAVFILSLVMMIAGLVFAVFMTIFQSQTQNERGTVSSLANAAMYLGTTIGGAVGGILLSKFDGFVGVAYFAIVLYLISLFVYYKAGAFSFNNNSERSIENR